MKGIFMKINIAKIGQVCFWLGLLMELIIVIIDKSAYINPVEGQLFRITFLLFCIKVATTKYSGKEWIVMLCMGSVASISYFVNERDEVVRIVAFIAACKDIPVRRILKVTLWVTFVGIVTLFLLAVFHVFGDLTVTANFGRGPFPGIVETRYCFGMGHPNAFQCMLFMVSTLYLYLYAEKMKLFHFAVVAIVNYVAFMYTDSNTGFLVAMAVILGITLLKYCRFLREHKFVYLAGAVIIIAIVFFSAIGAHTGRDTTLMYHVDQLLNGRFQYAHIFEAARLENWKLFADAANQEYFDQGFIRLFYWYGIIPALLYIAGNLYLIWQSCQKRDYCLLVIVVAYALFSLMEAHLISVYLLRNYLLIWFGYYWYQPFAENHPQEIYFWQVNKLIGRA